jgi:hypothetical protein
VLIINEALYFGSKMTNTLFCPNQLRQHGIVIEDCARQFDWSSSHSIFIPSQDICFPLSLNGIISGLAARQPTDADLEDFSLNIEMTSSEEWDPYSIDIALAEEKLQNDNTHMKAWNINSAQNIEINTVEDETLLIARMISAEKLSSEQAFLSDLDSPNMKQQIDAVIRRDLTSVLSPETLASRWGIGEEIARHTLDVTTQLGVRTILYPAQRHFRTAVPHLQYPHLEGTYYADTLFMNKTSVQGFTCAYVIGNGLGFTKFWPMVSKAD